MVVLCVDSIVSDPMWSGRQQLGLEGRRQVCKGSMQSRSRNLCYLTYICHVGFVLVLAQFESGLTLYCDGEHDAQWAKACECSQENRLITWARQSQNVTRGCQQLQFLDLE